MVGWYITIHFHYKTPAEFASSSGFKGNEKAIRFLEEYTKVRLCARFEITYQIFQIYDMLNYKIFFALFWNNFSKIVKVK